MSLPVTLAEVEDLGDWIGEPIVSEVDRNRAEMCLRVASALVRRESGRTWLDDTGALSAVPEDATLVTLYCAGRVFDNRNAQTRGGVDDYQEGWKVDESGAYLTASERRMLAPFRATGGRGIGTVATTRLPDGVNTSGWVPTPTPDVQFPWY